MREQFLALADDLTQLPRPEPAELRRATERRRRTRRLVTTAVGLTLVVGSGVGLGMVLSAGDQVIVDDGGPAASSTPTPAPTATSPAVVRAWLPEPWTLVDSATSTWADGEPSSYRFCGRAMPGAGPAAVAEQMLVHPSGQHAHLVEITPAVGGAAAAFQLFKFSFADCLVPGRARGVGGPRNVWSYGAVAGASEVVGPSFRVAELTGRSAAEAATRQEAEAALTAWTDR